MIEQLTKERREAYVEVLEILKHMDKKHVSKIPVELREFFERNASEEYEFKINPLVPLEQYELKNITINILAMLNINYWCGSETHKIELLKKYYENDIKKEKELREKYSVEEIFKKKETTIVRNEQENNSDIIVKEDDEKWYIKTYRCIVNFIKKIFKYDV